MRARSSACHLIFFVVGDLVGSADSSPSSPSRDSRVAGGRSPAGEEAAVVVVVTLAQSEYSELNLLSHVVLPESFFLYFLPVVLPESFFFHVPSQLAQPHDRRL